MTKVGVADPGHAPYSVPPLAKQHEGTDDPGSLFVVATLASVSRRRLRRLLLVSFGGAYASSLGEIPSEIRKPLLTLGFCHFARVPIRNGQRLYWAPRFTSAKSFRAGPA